MLLGRRREKQVYNSSLSGFKLFFGLFINFVWLWVCSPPGTVTFSFITAVLLTALLSGVFVNLQLSADPQN